MPVRNITTIMEEVDTPFGTIRIERSEKTGSHTYYQDKCFHSQSNAEGVSTCPYAHVTYDLVRQSGAKRVLVIGCAGGSLATMFSRLGCAVTMVDINDYAFTLAKRYFQLPDNVECVVDDGVDYLRRTRQGFDAIVIDVFDKKGRIPEGFLGPDFFLTARAALREKGIAVMNVMVRNDKDKKAERIAKAMETAGLPAALFDWPGETDRNTVVACGAVAGLEIRKNEMPFWLKPELKGLTKRILKKR